MVCAHGSSSQASAVKRVSWTVRISNPGAVLRWRVECASNERPTVAGSSASRARVEPAGAGRWLLSGTTPDGTTGVDLHVTVADPCGAAECRG